MSGRWAIGASLSATSGVCDDGDDSSVTRYLSTDWSLGSFALQPSVAYRLTDEWSLGAGLGINYTRYSWEAAVFNGIGQPDGTVEVEPDDIELNYILSVHWAPTQRTRFGISYRSEYQPKLEDIPDYSGVDPSRQSDSDLELEVTWPQSVLAGAHHGFTNGYWLSFDVLWVEASEFNIESAVAYSDGSLVINPYQLNDTWIFSAAWGLPLSARWSAGLGALYVHDPIDDENRSVLLRVDSLWGIGASIDYHRASGMTLEGRVRFERRGESSA